MITPINQMNRAMAESLYSWTSPRWPHPHAHVQYAEFHMSARWLDLCWWNGKDWQYVTTRPYAHIISPEEPAQHRKNIMETQTVTFTRTKETDKKVRFDAPQGAVVTGSLYITKAEAGDIQSLTVTVAKAS